MQLLQSSNYLVFYLVFIYCTVITVIVYHCLLWRFYANKRVQALIFFLHVGHSISAAHIAGNQLNRLLLGGMQRYGHGC